MFPGCPDVSANALLGRHRGAVEKPDLVTPRGGHGHALLTKLFPAHPLVGVPVQHPKPNVGIGARPAAGRVPDRHEVRVVHFMVATILLDGGDGFGRQKVRVLSGVGVIAQNGGLVQGGEEFAGEAQFLAQGDFLLVRWLGDGAHKIRRRRCLRQSP